MKKREPYYNMIWSAFIAALIVFGSEKLRWLGVALVMMEIGVISATVRDMIDKMNEKI